MVLNKYSLAALSAACAFLALAGCEETVYPVPTESYSSIGGFEITRVGDQDPGPYSIGDAEGDPDWGFWFPYSIAVDSNGDLLVTNIRGGYLERFIPNPDGGALWDAFWVWPRGRQHSTYQLFIESYPDPSYLKEVVLVSESQSEMGLVFEWGRQVHKLALPSPNLDIPGDNRPRYAQITQADILVGYPTTYQPGPVAYYPPDQIVYTDVALSYLFHIEGDSVTAEGGGEGDQEGRFYRPMGICVTPDETVVVSDAINHRLQTFTLEPAPTDPNDPAYDPLYIYPYVFSYQGTIGGFGFNNGQLSSPFGVAADAQGNIYVCDTRNARIQKFSSDGELLAVIYGDGYWRLRCPLDLAVTEDGDLWVIDAFLWYESWEDEYVPDNKARIILFRQD
ncbi:MAG TPA: NHL repeat-containing protein [bacterium]|nr:NHL repeat-containing protein [bacterium]